MSFRGGEIVGRVSAALLQAAWLAGGSAATAAAQPWPEKPLRMIVPVPAGGTPDVVARLVQPGLAAALGQPVVIDNRGGAGGLIGGEIAARSAPDGYTLFFSSPGPLTILPHLHKQPPYDSLRDFAPISLVSTGPFLLLVHPSVPAKSVADLVRLAKASPGRLNYASAGNGAANHLAMELFRSMAGLPLTHVPYKGAPQAVADLLGGQVDLMFNSIAPIAPHLRQGRLRALAISGARRSPQLPDVPTLAESGVPGYEAITWFGLLAPARTSPLIVARLNEIAVTLVRGAELRTQLEAVGHDPVGSTPEEFAAFLRRDHETQGRAVKLAGARLD